MDDAAATALRAPDGVTYFAYCFGKNGIYYIRAKVMKPYSEAAKAKAAKAKEEAAAAAPAVEEEKEEKEEEEEKALKNY